MSRTFDARNKIAPACIEALAAQVPACFTAADWRSYLMECARGSINEPAQRDAMRRGHAPNYCAQCTQGYSERMRSEGRCAPHPAAAKAVTA
jgi:hypothetical protein